MMTHKNKAVVDERHDATAPAGSCPPAFLGRRRNANLADLARVMRAHSASEKAISAALLFENDVRCKPPLRDQEIEQIVTQSGIDSALYTGGVRAETILKFQSAAEVEANTPDNVSWIACPWIAEGSITELDAKVKLGKTTFVTHLVRSVLNGETFLGQETTSTPVVYLTEQPLASFRETLRRAGLLGRSDLMILSWKDTIRFSWPQVVQAAVAQCTKIRAKLLIVDTIAQFAKLGGDAENNAGDALLAMAPLQEAAANGLGIVIIRHERKSGGDVGDSARGSSAFGAVADTILALRRQEGKTRPTLRVIHALSRFSGVPDELVIELTKDGFVSHGNVEDVATQEATAAILVELPQSRSEAIPMRVLINITKVSRTTAQRAINSLVQRGQISCTGKGTKKDPKRFWAPDPVSAQTLTVGGPIGKTEQDGSCAGKNVSPEVSQKMLWAAEALTRHLAKNGRHAPNSTLFAAVNSGC